MWHVEQEVPLSSVSRQGVSRVTNAVLINTRDADSTNNDLSAVLVGYHSISSSDSSRQQQPH
jgi:hypothetical protein